MSQHPGKTPDPAPVQDTRPPAAATAPRPSGEPAAPRPGGHGSTATLARPSGPNTSAVLLGLTCLVLAGLGVAKETARFTVDWGAFGPGALIAAGALLLVLGAVGLVRSRA